MLARCPSCDALVRIEPTEQPVGHTGTARRWRVAAHAVKTGDAGPIELGAKCEGSGKLI